MEKQRFRCFVSKVEPVTLGKLCGSLPFRFRRISVKENPQQFSLRVAPYMMGLAAPPGKEGEGYSNSAVQNSLDAGAVAAVAQTADNDQRVALPDQCARMFQGVVHHTESGIFQPACKAATARSILAVRSENHDIFIWKFKSREVCFIKIMNDRFQTAILSFAALSRTGKSTHHSSPAFLRNDLRGYIRYDTENVLFARHNADVDIFARNHMPKHLVV